MASMTIGRATSFAPDAYQAKVAANHIFDLLDRKSRIQIGRCGDECPVSTFRQLPIRNHSIAAVT